MDAAALGTSDDKVRGVYGARIDAGSTCLDSRLLQAGTCREWSRSGYAKCERAARGYVDSQTSTVVHLFAALPGDPRSELSRTGARSASV